MGNQITREYDVDSKRVIATGGPGLCWRVYNGTKKTSGRPVAVFLFEKRLFTEGLAKRISAGASGAGGIEQLVTLLKKEITTLSRLRHPCLLEIVEPLSESATTLAFATEPLIGNLANVLGNYTNFPNSIDRSIDKYELDELEIQKGVIQLAKALQFCHNDAKLVHGNLVPESIWINARGDWKLGGCVFFKRLTKLKLARLMEVKYCRFYFSHWNQYGGDQPVQFPEHNTQMSSFWLPNLDFAAPEYVLSHRLVAESDIFALGCLIHALYNNGASVIQSQSNILAYKSALERLRVMPTQGITSIIQELTRQNPSERLSLSGFADHTVFQNSLLAVVRFIDDLPSHTPVEKAQFFKSLASELPNIPDRIRIRKLLPVLLSELRVSNLAPFVLLSVFGIAEKLPPREFAKDILPSLRPLFKCTNPPQTLLVLVNQLPLIHNKLCNSAGSTFGQEIVPLLTTSLDSGVTAVQGACLTQLARPVAARVTSSANMLGDVAGSVGSALLTEIEYAQIKAAILPRIARFMAPHAAAAAASTGVDGSMAAVAAPPTSPNHVPLTGAEMELQIAAIQVLHAAVPALDRELVGTKLLPILRVCASELSPTDPRGILALLKVYSAILYGHVCAAGGSGAAAQPGGDLTRGSVDPVVAATQIVPALWRLAFAPCVASSAVFRSIMAEIRALSSALEQTRLRQLGAADTLARGAAELVTASAPATISKNGIGAGSANLLATFGTNGTFQAAPLAGNPSSLSARASGMSNVLAQRNLAQLNSVPTHLSGVLPGGIGTPGAGTPSVMTMAMNRSSFSQQAGSFFGDPGASSFSGSGGTPIGESLASLAPTAAPMSAGQAMANALQGFAGSSPTAGYASARTGSDPSIALADSRELVKMFDPF